MIIYGYLGVLGAAQRVRGHVEEMHGAAVHHIDLALVTCRHAHQSQRLQQLIADTAGSE